MLILNAADMLTLVDYNRMMNAVEDAYRIFSRGHYYMPNRSTVVSGRDTLLYMPCFTEKSFGTKFLSLFPDNPAKGIPYITGLMMLNDRVTGQVQALLDGSCLTALRTGAAGGVGIRCFAPADSSRVGVVGMGAQGLYQAVYACMARPVTDVYFFDAFLKDHETFLSKMTNLLGERMPRTHVCRRAEELVEASQIIITATASNQPVLPNDEAMLRGKCFIAIGSYKPEMRELPPAIWSVLDGVYTELPFALKESGDFSQPMDEKLLKQEDVRYIGDLLQDKCSGASPLVHGSYLYKSVGMALVDLCAAEHLYQMALEKGVGQNVRL